MTPLSFLLTLSGLVAMTMAADPYQKEEIAEQILQDMMEEEMSSEQEGVEALMMEAILQEIVVDAQKGKGKFAIIVMQY